jgi:hypothetical protein
LAIIADLKETQTGRLILSIPRSMQTDQVVVNSISGLRGFFSYVTYLLALLGRYEIDKIPVYVDWSGASNYRYRRRRDNVFDYFPH